MSFLEIYLFGYVIAFVLTVLCHFHYPYVLVGKYESSDLTILHILGYLLLSLLSFGAVGIIAINFIVDLVSGMINKYGDKVLIKVKK